MRDERDGGGMAGRRRVRRFRHALFGWRSVHYTFTGRSFAGMHAEMHAVLVSFEGMLSSERDVHRVGNQKVFRPEDA